MWPNPHETFADVFAKKKKTVFFKKEKRETSRKAGVLALKLSKTLWQTNLNEEIVTPMKSHAKFCATYATFSLTFAAILQPKALKKKLGNEWEI